MGNDNVYQTDPNEREDLKHTDTVATEESEPIGVRVQRDPSNLGNDIPEEGDLTHPAPVNQPLGKMPGM